jgi:hypothetical protein
MFLKLCHYHTNPRTSVSPSPSNSLPVSRFSHSPFNMGTYLPWRYFVSICIYSLWSFPINNSTQCMVFCVWLPLVSVIFLRFFHVVTWINTLLVFNGQITSHCMNILGFVCLFITWCIFKLFLLLTIIINAAVSIHVHVFVWHIFSVLLSIYLGVNLLGHMVTQFSHFFEIC